MSAKSDFEAYERVRQSGRYNMITESRKAAAEAGLSLDQYFAVIENYKEYAAKYKSPSPSRP